MADAIKVFAGLGNPGAEYEHTRHNAGAWLVSAIAREKGVELRLEPRFKSLCAKVSLNSQECWLLFPMTYMNHSGEAVAAMLRYYQIPVSQLLVIHDELDLPVGTCRFKKGGGHAGHNGLRNLVTQLGTADFLRLRVGIGHPGQKEKVLNYVLGTPSKHEKEEINVGLERAQGVLSFLVQGDIETAMQRLHSE